MIPRLYLEPTITRNRRLQFRFVIVVLVVAHGLIGTPALFAGNPVQTYTVTSLRGVPIAGLACGGSSHGAHAPRGRSTAVSRDP
jgi:hypothetical protein